MITVTLIPILSDNYAYLLEGDNGEVAVVDPGEAAPIIEVFDGKGLSPNYIFNTHHHGDHVHGNGEIKARYDAKIVAPAAEAEKIGNVDISLKNEDHFDFGGEALRFFETRGHTQGHLCFYAPESGLLFAGDTLFAMGCGRLFEGSAEDMFAGFKKIAALPDETKIYCGHEYTLSNAAFCASAEPYNEEIAARLKEVKAMRDAGKATLPTTLALEKQTNVFLRAKSAENFAALRSAKDSF